MCNFYSPHQKINLVGGYVPPTRLIFYNPFKVAVKPLRKGVNSALKVNNKDTRAAALTSL